MTGKRKPLGEDAENIDPKFNASLKASSKRKRSEADDDNENNENQDPVTPDAKASKPAKASRFAIKTIAPRILTTQPKPVTSSLVSPTKPAGRSPQASPSKSTCKPFARRSNVSKTRPELASRKGVSRPFSIAAALSGKTEKTAATPAPAPAPKKETPASWSFDIHVDTEEEEMTNLMQHSTGVLDISDDARSTTRGSRASSARGKENVPPSELGLSLSSVAPVARQQESAAAAARKSVMMEESRAPLGELNAADYYGADCHAFSYAVVYEDGNEQEVDVVSKPLLPRARPVRHSKLSSVSSMSSILEATVPAEPKPVSDTDADADAGKGIDIWESESAAEEAQ